AHGTYFREDCRLVQPLWPVVLGGIGGSRRKRRRRSAWSGTGRRRSRGSRCLRLVSIGLPPRRQAQEIKHPTCRENVPGIADQKRDEENHRDENRQHHL